MGHLCKVQIDCGCRSRTTVLVFTTVSGPVGGGPGTTQRLDRTQTLPTEGTGVWVLQRFYTNTELHSKSQLWVRVWPMVKTEESHVLRADRTGREGLVGLGSETSENYGC